MIAYLSDNFEKPYPFTPDVAIGIDEVIEKKMDMLHCHVSQMYEWLPFNSGVLDQVPLDRAERRKWLEHRLDAFRNVAKKNRDLLIRLYGKVRGEKIQFAEAFETCEYGGKLTEINRPVLYPFFG